MSIAIQTDFIAYYHVLFSLESEHEFEKLQKQTIFVKWQIYTRDFNYSILFSFSATNVNHFKFSIVHSNNDRSRISRQLKKSAQFVEAFIQNEFFIFESFRNNSKASILIALLSLQSFKNRNSKNVLKIKANNDFNKRMSKYFCQKITWRLS